MSRAMTVYAWCSAVIVVAYLVYIIFVVGLVVR